LCPEQAAGFSKQETFDSLEEIHLHSVESQMLPVWRAKLSALDVGHRPELPHESLRVVFVLVTVGFVRRGVMVVVEFVAAAASCVPGPYNAELAPN
jgi:hypothetical protein